MVKVITSDNFKEVTGSGKPYILDFYATWCGPCKMMSPVIEEISNERDDVTVGKIDVDEEPELAEAYSVQSIPTIVVNPGSGKEDKLFIGVTPKEKILDAING